MTTAHELAIKAKRLTPSFELPGYLFRKRFTIVGTTAGAQINYQMKLTVYKGTGFDSGAVVYLGGKCQDDFRDIRFTKSDGFTLLDYWIESIDPGVSAVVWIEFDFIPASPSTINFYIYYCNATAISASNGDNTFFLFDNFIGTSLDGTKWDTSIYAGGSITVSDGIVTITSVAGQWTAMGSKLTFPTNRRVVFRAEFSGWAGRILALSFQNAVTEGAPLASWISNYPAGNVLNTRTYVTVEETTNQGTGYTGYRQFAILRNATTNVIFQIDGSTVATHTTQIPTGSLRATAGSKDAYSIFVDWIFMANYISPEPTWGAWGGEETLRYKFPQFSLRRKYYG